MNVFDIANSVRDSTRVCTREEFERIIDSSAVANICKEISLTPNPSPEGEGSPEYREWKDAIAPLKKRLPVLLPHAHFTDNKRHKQSAEQSPWMSMDFDGIEDPHKFWNEKLVPFVETLRIVLAFISPSGKGIKIISQKPDLILGEGKEELEEAQRWFAETIGVENYDHTHDLARCVYLCPRKNFLLYKPEMLFAEEVEAFEVNGELALSEGRVKFTLTLPSEGKVKTRSGLTVNSEKREVKSQDCSGEDSLPYSKIIPEFFKLENANYPNIMEGMRNDTIFNVTAKYLRYCTDHSFRLIKSLLYPQFAFGLSEAEVEAIIKSALSRDRTLTPRTVKKIIAKCLNSEEEVDDDLLSEINLPPEMPKVLPDFIKLITSKVPDCCKPAVATQVFPALAAHLHQVQFRYIDNVEHEAGLMGVCVAQQSMGKGSVNKPIDTINADLKALNERNKELARNWRKESAESEEDNVGLLNENVFFPLPLVNLTDAAFTDRLRRLEHNGERTMFMKLDEIELLYQVNTGGDLKPDRLICLAYDRSEYGQERVNSNAISDSATIRWNWVASTTPPNGRCFFDKNNAFLNGALTRLNICTVIQPEDPNFMPRYGIYDDEFNEEVAKYVENLNKAKGMIYCKKINNFIETLRLWCVDKLEEYDDKTERTVFRDFYKRALVITFRKAMVLYITSGMVWTRAMEDFMEWSLKYDLWCKFYYFGDLMISAYKNNQFDGAKMLVKTRVTKMEQLFEQLPEEFTKTDVEELKESLLIFTDTRNLISKLKKAGAVEKSGKKTYRKLNGKNVTL